MRPEYTLPPRIERIVINDEPIRSTPIEHGYGRIRVMPPVISEPYLVGGPRVFRRCTLTCWSKGQANRVESLLAHESEEVAVMLATDETALRALLSQASCQRQATHHVPGANFAGCINPEDEPHRL